ncbi:MAG: hypothetical protein J7621_03090 [Niastella sp.]|nr:hypothetical protein [Niastella sp.]
MLEIINHTLFKKDHTYARMVDRYLPETGAGVNIYSDHQRQLIQQLRPQVKKEFFFTITDVRTGKIIYSEGVDKWLGFASSHFNQKTYLGCLHPGHAVVQNFFSLSLFDLLIGKEITAGHHSPVCTGTIALKNSKGSFLYCKKTSYPFFITNESYVGEYLSEYIIIKGYAGEDYSMVLNDDKVSYNERIYKRARHRFEENSGFSTQELRIIKRYAYSKDPTSEQIAQAFKIQKGTVDKFNKRILKKTELLYKMSFANAKDTALYFRKTGLI